MEMHNKIYFQIKAFTLAEVLITLMIIGILAMVTLPSLVQTLEKNTLKSQIKRELAILEEALKLTLIDDDYACFYKYENGVNRGAVSGTDCTRFFDNFYSKLKVVKTCKGNALSSGCIPVYDGLLESNVNCPGVIKNNINNINYARLLSDGTIIMQYGPGNSFPIIVVDVNGIKPPNMGGRDVIIVKITKDIEIRRDSFIIDGNINVCGTSFGSAANRYFNNVQDLYK